MKISHSSLCLVCVAACIAVGSTANAQTPIAAWDFTGENTGPATSTAEVRDANLTLGLLTRGAGASASTANNSFRTTGFKNDGIATSNTDYFQTTIAAAPGYTLSLSTIDARVAGTSTFRNAPEQATNLLTVWTERISPLSAVQRWSLSMALFPKSRWPAFQHCRIFPLPPWSRFASTLVDKPQPAAGVLTLHQQIPMALRLAAR